MAGYPYMQFFTGDWLKDPCLTFCSPAARGVWIDLLSAMHESGRSGELRGTPDQLARLARCLTSELMGALTELQTTKTALVTERNGIVTVVNRRMKREAKSRDATRSRVNRHRRNGHVTVNGRPSNGVDPYPESDPKGKEPPVSASVRLIRDTQELKRVEKAISDIRGSYSEHQGMTAEDRAKIAPLKARRTELLATVGFKV